MKQIHHSYLNGPAERPEIGELLSRYQDISQHQRILLLAGYLEILNIIHQEQLGVPVQTLQKILTSMQQHLGPWESTLGELLGNGMLQHAIQQADENAPALEVLSVTEQGYALIENIVVEANFSTNNIQKVEEQ
ncbi:hypothetical protein LGV61_04330 [Desulfurispirillum indicum]|nr:hypothetical protein [Desulfurispirillum indicum]UCZ57512.1 hypothetical protein LGV61_04330 [Desulfurispirillum indicum]